MENFENKDLKRINDIITKSKGDDDKATRLATTMANRITKTDKIVRRMNAAEHVLGDWHPVTQAFIARKRILFAG